MTTARDRLSERLRATTVAITAGNRVGSGFVVAPGWVLTCGHVVADADEIVGQLGQETISLSVEHAFVRPAVDLALLRTSRDLGCPVAGLGPAVSPGDELWAYGYPDGTYRGGESAALEAVGPSLRHDQELLVKVAQRSRVGPGFSGAPVLNWRTGAVCGVLRLADKLADKKGDVSGARLTPTATIVEQFPELAKTSRADLVPWLDILDDDQLVAGQWDYPGRRLREFLRATEAAAREHPYALALPNAPALSTVYLRQNASGQNARGQDGKITEEEALASARVEAGRVLDLHDSARIIGSPGAGKSSLLRYLAGEAASDLLAGKGTYVPVYIHASGLTRGAWQERLAAAASHMLSARLDRSLNPDMFETSPLTGKPWLIMIDGVDEVLDPGERGRLFRDVSSRLDDPRFRFLIASRPLSDAALDRHLGQLAAFELEPFDESQLPQFAMNWFIAAEVADLPGSVTRFVGQVRGGKLRELARLPLIATMLCVLFINDPERDLPPARAALYRDFLHLLLDKGPEQLDSFEQLRRRAAQFGASAAGAVDKLMAGMHILLKALARAAPTPTELLATAVTMTEDQRPESLRHDQWESILRDALRHTGVLVERIGSFAFAHETLREFLSAAHQVATTSPEKVARDLREQVAAESRERLESELLFLAALLADGGFAMDEITHDILRDADWPRVFFVADMLLDGITVGENAREMVLGKLYSATESASISGSGFYGSTLDAAARLVLLDFDKGLDGLRNVMNVAGAVLDRVEAVRRLAEYRPAEGTDALARIAGDPAQYVYARAEAAAHLSRYRPDTGFDVFADLLSRQVSVSSFIRPGVVGLFLSAYRTRAEAHLREMARAATHLDERILAAGDVMAFDSNTSNHTLSELLLAKGLSPAERFRAMAIIETSLPSSIAVPSLITIAADPSNDPQLRLRAAQLVARADDSLADGILVKMAVDDRIPLHVRVRAAREGGQAGRAILLSMIEDQRRRPATRLSIAKMLLREDREAGRRALQRLALDPSLPEFVRAEAAREAERPATWRD